MNPSQAMVIEATKMGIKRGVHYIFGCGRTGGRL